MIKYTTTLLKKVEGIFDDAGYDIRYEKGTFQNGYCVLETKKVVVINRFLSLESRISGLIEILDRIDFKDVQFSEDSVKTLQRIRKDQAEQHHLFSSNDDK